jgi:pyruvate,water dikinase
LPIQAEKSLYDLAQWCIEHPGLATYLQSKPVAQLVEQVNDGEAPPDVEGDVWRVWQDRFRAHVDQYGYSIYDLDFVKPIPAHDPTPPLQMLQVFLRGQGRDPHARQQQLYEQRVEAIEAVRARTKGLKRKLFDKTLGWAQTFTQAREDSIFEIGLAYPSIREMLLELGHRFAKAEAIAVPDDVFWLERDEVKLGAELLDRGEPVEDHSQRVEQRKMRWRAAKQVTPPGNLPESERIMGIKTDVFMPVSADKQTGNVLKGVGASPGTITASARVLHGPENFAQMAPGAILVADVTTPAWTPLFAMASGIVTNVGGPLSHGSIVAREYGIPAVLGTGVATKRIHNDQVITVDGTAGLVTLTAEEA